MDEDEQSKITALPEVQRCGRAMEQKVEEMFGMARVVFEEYCNELKSTNLSDFISYKNAGMRKDCESITQAVESLEKVSQTLNKTLRDFRKELTTLHETMQQKFEEEQMTSFIPYSDEVAKDEMEQDQAKEERLATQKAQIARSHELKLASARAAHEVAESHLRVTKAEGEAVEAENQARKAREIAEDAARAARKAKLASEEKRKREEELRKRDIELRRLRAEQEAKRKEEEERRMRDIAESEGRTVDEVREREREMREKNEAKRKDPNNWPCYPLECEQNDFKPPVAMFLRVYPGTLRATDVHVRQVLHGQDVLKLVESEELISNILELEPVDPDFHPKLDEAMSIVIPHCAPRTLIGREPLVKTLTQTGQWNELPTRDINMDMEVKFAEGRSRKFGIFVVVLVPKREKFSFSRRGDKQMVDYDHRVTFTAPAGAVNYTTYFTVDLTTMDVTHADEVRSHQKYVDATGLISSSPIVRIVINNRHMAETINVTVPVPSAAAVRAGQDRHTGHAAAHGQQAPPQQRMSIAPPPGQTPLIGFDLNDQETTILLDNDSLFLVIWDAPNKKWVLEPSVNVTCSKKSDTVSFDTKEMYERFMVVRTNPTVKPDTVPNLATAIERQAYMRTAVAYCKQRYDDPHEIACSVILESRTQKEQQTLQRMGYVDGPQFSDTMQVTEGQTLEIRSKGNISVTSGDIRPRFAFHSHMPLRLIFRVDEVDHFAQKGFDSFMGHLQFYTKGTYNKFTGDETSKGGSKRVLKTESSTAEGDVLLAELAISLPKPLHEPAPVPHINAIIVRPDGPISTGLLRGLARDLGDVDIEMLAGCLHMDNARLQSVKQQFPITGSSASRAEAITNVLICWFKRQPVGVDKLELLANAMQMMKKNDVADKLRKVNNEFRKKKAYEARESHLTKAFVTVARNASVLRNWKGFAEAMGLEETEVEAIDAEDITTPDKVVEVLKKWHEMKGSDITIDTLASQLKMCRFRALAKQVERTQ